MEIQVLDGEIFILLSWCPVLLLYLWACHRLWYKPVFLGVHNSAVKHQLQAECWPKRMHGRNAYLQMVESGGWGGVGGRQQSACFNQCLEVGVYCICTTAFSLLQLNKGFEKSSQQKEILTWSLFCSLHHLGPQSKYLMTVTAFSRQSQAKDRLLKTRVCTSRKQKRLFPKPS